MYQKPEIDINTLHTAATATGNGTAIAVNQYVSVGVSIEGISGDTITFEGTINNGTDWYAVKARNLTSGAEATTATADGVYAVNVTGLVQFRARISTYGAGTITVIAISTTAQLAALGASLALGSIAAGSNIIGKVGVDQTTEGTTNRVVSGKATVIAVTPTVDASALDANDTVFDATAIANAARASGLGTTLMAVDVICQADQKAQLTLYFFDASVTFGTSDAAPSLSDADALKYLGHVDIAAADYDDLGGVSVAQARNLSIPMIPASGTSLYVAATTTGTPTYGATDALKLRFHFLCD